jgi:type I restriction enzyme S subunit
MSDSLPENWAQVPLKDLILPTGTISPATARKGNIRYIDIESVDNERQEITNPKIIPASKAPSRARRKVLHRDVIFSLVRPYLKNLAIIPEELDGEIASTAFFVSRPASGVQSEWLYQHLRRDSVINALPTVGSSPPATRDVDFEEHLVQIAPTNEQQRILTIFESTLAKIDEAEEALERVKRNLDLYRASVLKAACEGRLVPTEVELARQEGRDYEHASQLLKRILIARRVAWEKAQLEAYAKMDKTPPKDWKSRYTEPQTPDTSDLPELPEGWCWASIDQIVAKTNYGTSVRCDFESTGVPVLRIPNISAGKVSFEKLKFATVDLGVTVDDYLELGDLIICRTNGSLRLVGKCAVYDTSSTEKTHFASYLIRLRFVLRAEHGRWIWAILSSPMGRGQIEAIAASSAGQHNISLGNLQQFPVPLPPLFETSRIIEKLGEVEASIETLCKSSSLHLRKLSTLRQSLLKHAFSGKLVPQDPRDEPASVLLERIRTQRREMEGSTTPRKRAVRKTKKSS